MDLLELVILAVVQGVTEFLPISSQAHNILVLKWMGTAPGSADEMVLNVAVHLGSLFAVIIYFWGDTRAAVVGPFTLVGDVVARRPLQWSSRLALLLLIATVPLIAFYLALNAVDAVDKLRTVEIIGWTTIIFGVLLYVADRFSTFELEMKDWRWGGAVMLGLGQALAIIPGVSRAGVTMTMARFLGFERREAARIAILMAIPAILASGAKGGYDLFTADDAMSVTPLDALIAAALSMVSAYLAIVLMMRWLSRATFTPFVVYRLILGAFLLWTAYAPV